MATLALGVFLLPVPAAGQEGGHIFTARVEEGHPYRALTSGLTERLASAYNLGLAPPHAMVLGSESCGRADAYSETTGEDEDDRVTRVILCSELLEEIVVDLQVAGVEGARSDSLLEAAVFAVYAMETGRALEPWRPGGNVASGHAGRQFVALTFRQAPRYAHYASLYWVRRAAPRLPEEEAQLVEALPPATPAYGPEKGLDEASFEEILCWVYGVRPAARRWIVEASLLDPSRAGGCERAYATVREGWGRLLYAFIQFPEAPPPVLAGAGGADRGADPAAGAETPAGGRVPSRLDTTVERPGEAGYDTTAVPGAPRRKRGPAYGDAPRLWSLYDMRVGDYGALLLADFLRAERDLPEPAVVTYEPQPGTIDIEIYGSDVTRQEAEARIEAFWTFVEERFLPYVERRFGPELGKEDFRILYYDATDDDLRTVAGMIEGRLVTP